MIFCCNSFHTAVDNRRPFSIRLNGEGYFSPEAVRSIGIGKLTAQNDWGRGVRSQKLGDRRFLAKGGITDVEHFNMVRSWFQNKKWMAILFHATNCSFIFIFQLLSFLCSF